MKIQSNRSVQNTVTTTKQNQKPNQTKKKQKKNINCVIVLRITLLLLSLCVVSIGLTSPSCNFPFEDLTDAEDSLVSDTEDNIGIDVPATSLRKRVAQRTGVET